MSICQPSTILLVENNPEDVALFGRAWRHLDLDLSLEILEDGEQAMNYLLGRGKYKDRRRFPFPALVLIALSLSGKDGFELLEWRRSQMKFWRLPFIVLTAAKNLKDIIHAYNLGANGYLIKPIKAAALKEKINELILPVEQPIRLLLMDSREKERQLIARELRREFPKIVIQEITTVEEFKLALESDNFDLMVTELSGPGWSGVNNLRLIKAHFPDCPVIMLTRSATEEELIEVMAAGLDDLVLKTPEAARVRLPLAIRRALGRSWQQQALRESEERYRYISQTISDYAYAFRVEEDGRLQGEWITDSFVRAFGFTRREVDERGGWQSMVFPEDLPVALEHARKVATGQTDVCEFRFVTRGGEVRWLRDYATPVWDEAKARVTKIYGASQDITEKKRTERLLAALNQAQTALAGCRGIDEIFESIKSVFQELGFSCMLFPYDQKTGRLFTRFLSFESKALRMVEELVGFRHEEFSIRVEQTRWFREAIYNQKTILITDIESETLSWLPGIPEWLAKQIIEKLHVPKAIVTPLLIDGRVEGVISVQSNELREADIPAVKAFGLNIAAAWERIKYIEQLESEIRRRREVEDSLRESEERYRTLTEASPDMISVVNLQSEIEYVNANAARQFGLSAEEMIGKKLNELFSPEEAAAMQEFLHRVAANKEPTCLDGPISLGQKKMWLNTWLVPIKDKNNQVYSILTISRDITDRKKAEDEIRESYAKLRAAFGGIIKAISSVVEVKDPYTAGHQRRVADLSRAIATEMGLSKDKIEGIRMAGSIHDIGKISLPAEILSKPGQLNKMEWELIKTHPEVGYEILKDIEFPWPVAAIVRQHHERLDGSGYPQGLKGDQIMIEARILAVADVVEAMAYHRPYRPAHGVNKALAEISQKKGFLYDPLVVDTCLKLFMEKGYKFPE